MERQTIQRILGVALAACILGPESATAAPELINHQGRIVQGDTPLNGDHVVVFRLFNAATNGLALYEETQTVSVVDGLYSTSIGLSNSVPGALSSAVAGDPIYLELTVGGQPLSPRERLASVPYAMHGGVSPCIADYVQVRMLSDLIYPATEDLETGFFNNIVFQQPGASYNTTNGVWIPSGTGPAKANVTMHWRGWDDASFAQVWIDDITDPTNIVQVAKPYTERIDLPGDYSSLRVKSFSATWIATNGHSYQLVYKTNASGGLDDDNDVLKDRSVLEMFRRDL